MTSSEKLFRGTAVSPGVAVGSVLKLDSRRRVVLELSIPPGRVEDEVARFERARALAREQIAALKVRLEEKVGREHSYILDAHLLMLEDRSLLAEIVSSIRTSRVNAEWAVRRATDRIREAYGALEEPYFRERGSDIENVVERILLNLTGTAETPPWNLLPEAIVVVARDFDPSSFALLGPQRIRGLALESGGRTSHSAIIARGLRIPAVMEIRDDIVSSVNAGDLALLDGDAGEVVVQPSARRLERFSGKLAAASVRAPAGAPLPPAPARTSDGVAVSLLANLELPDEVRVATRYGAEGIGLFRSEFLFFSHPRGSPSVDEQLETYRRLAEEVAPLAVTVRTLDADPDRIFRRPDSSAPSSSALGLRGIRLSLGSERARALFATQVEAILRASRHGRMEIVLPMVSAVEEVREARSIIAGMSRALAGQAAVGSVPLGIMIEVPAAVLQLETLAREADFLVVGTNDLIQYTLAVDREDADVQHLYQPLHPAVLRALARIARVAGESAKPVRVCGEIAANPYFAALLVGIGFRQLSMNPHSIPALRQAIAALTMDETRALAERVLELPTAQEAGDFLVKTLAARPGFDRPAWAREVQT